MSRGAVSMAGASSATGASSISRAPEGTRQQVYRPETDLERAIRQHRPGAQAPRSGIRSSTTSRSGSRARAESRRRPAGLPKAPRGDRGARRDADSMAESFLTEGS
jgi:hypothetical protein